MVIYETTNIVSCKENSGESIKNTIKESASELCMKQ